MKKYIVTCMTLLLLMGCNESSSTSDKNEESNETTEIEESNTSQSSNGIVYIGFMIHLEDNWTDDKDEISFNNHAKQLIFGADLIEPYGAKFTAESALPFAKGCVNWGDNVLQSMLDKGMGVGSHSNTVALYAETKVIIDQLVGVENNRGISGGWGNQGTDDWAQEATKLGFKYLDALVLMGYYTVPEEDRPANMSNAYIDENFHDPAPDDFATRIHPHRVTSATSWPNDTEGEVVLLTGSLGALYKLDKNATEEFDEEDVEAFIEGVKNAVALSTSENFTVVYTHSPLKLYTPQNAHLFEKLFEGLEDLKDQGLIQYGTQGEIYDKYIEWEKK